MPLRSPKMYFCIFGFQRLVWWPKCTPASSSSFMVKAAMDPPSVFPPPPARSPHGPAPMVRRRVWSLPHVMYLAPSRGVLGVDAHVLLGQVRRHHLILARSQSQVDGDGVFRAAHDLANLLQPNALPEDAPLHDRLVAKGDAHPRLVDPRRRFAESHHDAAPVGILAVDGRLHEGRVGHAAGGRQG